MSFSNTFTPPKDWLQITTIDMHTGGEPLRVILDGLPEIKGNTVLERRRYLMDHLDYIRTALMHEPRGHADMYGCILTPPNDQVGDFGIIFLHNEGYSTMCGHAIIAISKLAVEMGWVKKVVPETVLQIDAPCGRIQSFVKIEKGQVESVRFHCVPSFVVELDAEVEVPKVGKVRYDLAYGGAYYAYVQAENLGIELVPENYSQLIDLGRKIKQAVISSGKEIQHPYESDLSFLYGTIFIDASPTPGIDSRNVCVFADGEVDRCPTGSGVSGRMAIHHARKEIGMGESMQIESITESIFRGSVVRTEDYGPFTAVIPEVEGTAFITGQHTFLLDPQDPFREGFFLR
ncbi:MAG: proline racemase family protein [Bacteroidota bacterium]